MRSALISVVLVGLSATAVWSAPGVKPGYWETTSRVLAPIHSTDTERRCVTQDQVRKFMSCYINHHYDCLCVEDTVGDGKIAFKGQCIEHKNGSKVGVVGSGTYNDTTLTMSADATFKLLGIPMTAKATIEGKRLAETCPAGAN